MIRVATTLQADGITAHYFAADSGDSQGLANALDTLEAQLGSPAEPFVC